MVYPLLCDGFGLLVVMAGDGADEFGQRPCATDGHDGFGAPGVALFTERSRLVFCLPGFQGGLLRQREHFDHTGFASVLGLELLGQLSDAVVDGSAPRRPPAE